MSAQICQSLLLLLTGTCAAGDLLTGKIYNKVLLLFLTPGIFALISPPEAGAVSEGPGRGTAALLSFFFLYCIWSMTGGAGIGGGDVKLFTLSTLFMDGAAVLPMFLTAALLALFYGLGARCLGRRKSVRLAPFLFTSCVLSAAGCDFLSQPLKEVMRMF
jgi:Flp pilus assembly protein protease CpaA